jgi:hypothetical protein
MPRIRRQGLPPRLLDHLLDRASERKISAEQFKLLADWLQSEPVVPEGQWFKKFSGMTVCGEGELIKTFFAARTNCNRRRDKLNAPATGRAAHARGWAMTEIKLGRTPSTLRSSPTAEDGHSLPRRSNSPRRNAVKTGAKTGAFRT